MSSFFQKYAGFSFFFGQLNFFISIYFKDIICISTTKLPQFFGKNRTIFWEKKCFHEILETVELTIYIL